MPNENKKTNSTLPTKDTTFELASRQDKTQTKQTEQKLAMMEVVPELETDAHQDSQQAAADLACQVY